MWIMAEASFPGLCDSRRRTFLKALGGGVLMLVSLPGDIAAQESGGHGGHHAPSEEIPQNIGAWLHIAPDSTVTVFTGKAEVGQNIRTSLTQAVADELRCDPSSIQLVMADTALTPFDMGTFGSRTTPTMAPQLRKAASSMRELLVDEAARKWGVDRSQLRVEAGRVSNGASGKSSRFGDLAQSIDAVNVVASDAHVTAPPKWQIAGKPLLKLNARAIVSGEHQYASDIRRQGMVHGSILRPSSFGATLTSVDAGAIANLNGVNLVREGDFVGVTAPDEYTARKAISSIKAQWKEQPQISNAELFGYLKANTEDGEKDHRQRDASQDGSIEAGLGAAHKKLQSTYTVAFIAHTPLEPRAAVAQWNGSKLTVWTGSQRPFGVRNELSEAFGLSESDVRVIVPDTGSAYGGKHSGECAIEAARLAKAAGKPVKLVWTREEEFTWAYFRPAGVIEISSGISKDGLLTAWEFHNYNSGPSGIETPYEVPNRSIHFHSTKSPLKQGSYRGLAATANHFARESHMDELAAGAGLDPLEFRLKNLKHPRMSAVLEAAADRFGWGKAKPRPGHGYGLACGTEKGGYVACCAEISMTPDRKLRVERVVEAFECGAIVNPEHLKNQIEGAIVMGLGGALFESIQFANGRILNPRLSEYRVPRFSDVPKIEVVLVDRKDLPSAGAGETPIVGIAPAVANAIFSASGVRVRSMPMLPGLKSSAAV
jgi:isoquinoline 1-oxidoreductase